MFCRQITAVAPSSSSLGQVLNISSPFVPVGFLLEDGTTSFDVSTLVLTTPNADAQCFRTSKFMEKLLQNGVSSEVLSCIPDGVELPAGQYSMDTPVSPYSLIFVTFKIF